MQEATRASGRVGLSVYSQRFAENDIDVEVLTELTDTDCDRLGVSIGHRRKMIRAIREFAGSYASATGVPAFAEVQVTRRV
jgi:hypothetical protein